METDRQFNARRRKAARHAEVKWFNDSDLATLKQTIIKLLGSTPRSQWVAVIMRKFSHSSATRVAIFQLFCKMEQSGELDELKERSR